VQNLVLQDSQSYLDHFDKESMKWNNKK